MTRRHSTPPILSAALAAACSVPSAMAVEDEDLRFKTTEDLYQVCSVAPAAAEYIPASFACRGFIEGAVQYHDAVTDRNNLKRLICYPQNATVADGRKAFVAWAKSNADNQNMMGEVPDVGLVRALAAEYPCGN